MGRSKKSDSSLAVRLGERIKSRRLALRWTQEDLAGRLGVEVNTISRMECGVHLPSLQRLENLAATLDVPIASLLGGASSTLQDQTEQFREILDGLSRQEREHILATARLQSGFLKARK
ncbi:hypothetical protein MASR1M60_27830 [Rhodocyclaceae bacterium]